MPEKLLSPIQNKIVQEISKAFEKFGATSDLLAIVNSWGDTLEESEVFEMLAHWNSVTEPDTLGAHWMECSTRRGRELIAANARIRELEQQLSGARQDLAEQAVLQDPDPLAEMARAAEGNQA
jgi:hypothetical protein